MRKITPECAGHNAGPRAPFRTLLPLLVLGTLLTVVGCSKDQGSTGDKAATGNDVTADCNISTDISAWAAFTALADRVDSGESVTKKEFDAYGDLPTVSLWRNSLKPGTPSAERVGNWLEGTFWEQLDRPGMQKTSADRANFSRRFRYCLDKREDIEQILAELTGPRKCELQELAAFWIEPDRLPESLTIHFLPAKPEIRISAQALLVDTGVLAAGSIDQVIRQMASLLYRNYQFQAGGNPLDLQGEQALVQSFRVLMNEGMTGWVEKAVDMEFDSRHPELYKVKIIPEEFYLKAQRALGMMNRQLGPILADEDILIEKGQAFARHLAGMNAFSQTGFAMAAVISFHFGDERLREARGSVPAFLATYQEAALLNPVPTPAPGTPGVELYQTVPPLEPEIFTRLHALLTKNFPQ